MKHSLFLITFFISSVTFSSCQTKKTINCIFPKNSVEVENLKGSVSSVRTQTFKAVLFGDKVEKGGKIDYPTMDGNSFVKFNKDGFMSESLYYNDKTSELNRRELMGFNQSGCPSSIKIYDNGKLSWGEKITYNYNNSELTSQRINDKGEVTSWQKIKFGKYGEEQIERFSNDGRMTSKTVYKYNEREEVYLALTYDNNGILTHSDTTKYDYNINSVMASLPDSTIITDVRNSDNLITERYSKSPRFTYTRTFSYQFDKMGNWIKKIEFDDGKPHSITERIITYY